MAYSQKVFLFGCFFSKKCAKSLALSFQPKVKKLRIVIWQIIFRKRLSEIEPPLNSLLSKSVNLLKKNLDKCSLCNNFGLIIITNSKNP